MKNKKLIQKVEQFYKLSSSASFNKFAEADEFDIAAETIKPIQPKVTCKNGHLINKNLEPKPAEVSQFMVVSTEALKEDSVFLADDALVFIFLNEDQYLDPSQYPDDDGKLNIAKKYAKRAGINTDGTKYYATLIGKSKVRDKKDADNSRYSHCVAIFKVE
jgi:hypothetical protein